MGQQRGDAAGAAQGPGGRSAGAAAPAGFRAGATLLLEGFALLRRERRLWSLALVPLAFSLAACVLALSVVYANAGALYALIHDALPVFEVEAWYQWIWLGPVRLGVWLTAQLAFLLAAGLALVLSLMLASVAAAPFLDALSWRVELLVAGRVAEGDEGGLGGLARDVWRSLVGEARRMLFFLGIWGALFGAGLVIPGAHLVTGPLMMLITIVFLPLEYSGYALDRRRVPFRARRAWVLADLPSMLGFGAAAFVGCFVPGLNLVVIPALVVGGTLLVLRRPPQEGLS